MPKSLVVYIADGCHLCDDAIAAIEAVRRCVPFELTIVDIGGDDELEARYRVELPVIEIDGERVVEYEVDVAALRSALL